MASLANQTISSTYDGLVKTSTDQPVGVSGVQLLEDGVGNSLALSVGRANQGVTVTGPLTGTLSATSVLADGVIATTQATSDNSTKVATTAYVKSVVTAEDLDIAGDSGTGAIDLDSQTLTIEGTANEIETSASGQTITIGLPSTITANVTGNVSGNLTGTVLTAAQANITSVGTLTGLTVSADALIQGLTVGRGGGDISTNTAIGNDALDNNTTGSLNSAFGRSALINNTTGTRNIAIGFGAGDLIATGSNNTIIGDIAGTAGLSDTIILAAGTTERFRVNASGNMVFPNGKGIDFSASEGGGATSSLLDDYEEGTFTPEVADAATGGNLASGSFDGTYTKIGRLVTVTVDLNDINTSGMTSGNNLFIRNLPFTALQDSAYGAVSTHGVSFVSASYTFMTAQASTATNYARIRQCGGGVGDFATTVALIDASTSDIYFSLSYFV